MKRFNEDELETIEQNNINSRIMEQASDIAEKLCELECKLNGIECYVVEMEGETEVSSYTEEAQEIFDVYYDEQKTQLYDLLNCQLEIMDEVNKFDEATAVYHLEHIGSKPVYIGDDFKIASQMFSMDRTLMFYGIDSKGVIKILGK